jgi:hypothetical protein
VILATVGLVAWAAARAAHQSYCHDHSHARHSAQRNLAEHCHHDDYGHHHHDPGNQSPGVPADHHDDCSLCQSLAQQPLPPAILQVVPVSEQVSEVAIHLPSRYLAILAFSYHSRAPPISGAVI